MSCRGRKTHTSLARVFPREVDVFRHAMLALVAALLLVGSVDAHAQVNVTGGYICQGNCAAPGQCSRAYVDGFWPGRNHIAFYNNVGPASEGAYVSATRVVATGWGLGGVVYPDRIVWYRPGVRRPYAVWIRNPACPY
jgi:uncharacterized membrane protein